MALLLHVTRYSIFSNSSIILPGLRASIGVTCSHSSRLFLGALAVEWGLSWQVGRAGLCSSNYKKGYLLSILKVIMKLVNTSWFIK